MSPKIVFANLVRQLLPSHMRLPNRLAILRALIAPLTALYAGFDAWRSRIRIEINMTSQVGVLEGYLRAKFNNSLIRIASYADGGLSIGMEYEGELVGVAVGISTSAINVPMEDEVVASFGDADFVVYLPASFSETQIEAIKREVNQYKQVLTTYKIVN